MQMDRVFFSGIGIVLLCRFWSVSNLSKRFCTGRGDCLRIRRLRLVLAGLGLAAMTPFAVAKEAAPEPVVLGSGWQLQDVAKAPEAGAEVSAAGFKTAGWYAATVPGTVLTTLVNNHVYPEPLYGENNRPETIPESLNKTSYWYRTVVEVPKDYKHKHIWLNFP